MPNMICSEDLPTKGIGLKSAQRRELEDKGLFPRRVYYSERKHGYVEAEIDAYIKARICARDNKFAAKQTEAA